MSSHWTFDLVWWVTAVELPALAGLFWLTWRTRRDGDAGLNRLDHRTAETDTALRERLAADRLEIAKSYASIANLQDVERRLTAHLLRIEAKLDAPLLGGRQVPTHGAGK